MTWSEFRTMVENLLPVEVERLNTQTYLTSLIRQAVLDLQTHIPYYTQGHQTFYTSTDVITNHSASVGNLPSGAKLQDMFVIGTGTTCCRMPVTQYDWGNRNDLICGHPGMGLSPLVAIDDRAEQFILYPAIDADAEIELNWDGKKADFEDTDSVPFDEEAAGAVADYCMAMISRKIKNDITMYNSYLLDYAKKRRILVVDKKEAPRILKTQSSPQPEATCAQCACTEETPSENEGVNVEDDYP